MRLSAKARVFWNGRIQVVAHHEHVEVLVIATEHGSARPRQFGDGASVAGTFHHERREQRDRFGIVEFHAACHAVASDHRGDGEQQLVDIFRGQQHGDSQSTRPPCRTCFGRRTAAYRTRSGSRCARVPHCAASPSTRRRNAFPTAARSDSGDGLRLIVIPSWISAPRRRWASGSDDARPASIRSVWGWAAAARTRPIRAPRRNGPRTSGQIAVAPHVFGPRCAEASLEVRGFVSEKRRGRGVEEPSVPGHAPFEADDSSREMGKAEGGHANCDRCIVLVGIASGRSLATQHAVAPAAGPCRRGRERYRNGATDSQQEDQP